MLIKLTEKAIKEIKHIVEEQNQELSKVALRVKVVGGGCSGWSAKLELDEVFGGEKDVIDVIDGVTVAIDKRSALYVSGAEVDFHDSIDKRGFIVNNPNAKSTCGCNSSFSM